MAEPFKNLINAARVAQMAVHLQRVWPAFARARFEKQASTGLEALELKARMLHITDALEATLPPDFSHAAEVIEASLAPPLPIDAKGEPVSASGKDDDAPKGAGPGAGVSGWAVWPLGEFVARRGLADVPRALDCLHALTQRFTAEFAIRPFIRQSPDQVFPTLQRWVRDPSAHVRRLVSEGSRPRLPWGLRLQALVADPSPTLPLLRALQDDPSAYVRRSVANHLNDIAKDHPETVARWVVEHQPGASPQRLALLRHASRGLLRQGHAPTLAAWGLGKGLQGKARLRLLAPSAAIGEYITLEAAITSTSRQPQKLEVDYAVHHVRANGTASAKVFKGWKLTLAAGESRAMNKRHSLREVTTRRLYPGAHRVDLVINGRPEAHAAFELLPAPATAR